MKMADTGAGEGHQLPAHSSVQQGLAVSQQL